MYLYISWLYADIFLNDNATLLSKVTNASTVANFFRIWRSKLRLEKCVQKSMLSHEALEDILLSCHAVVMYIMVIRDSCPGHPVELGLTGTDCCESYFSENGSFVMNRHVYSYSDLLSSTTKMTILDAIAGRGNIQVGKVHSKQESIWDKGHHSSSNPVSSEIPTDHELCTAWEQGLTTAQNLWKSLGVSSSEDWFLKPYYDELHVARDSFLQPQETVESEDNESESENESEDAELEAHLRNTLLDSPEESQGYNPTIDVPGVGSMYKSTLVTMLNAEGGKISKDRLVRVRGSRNTDDADISVDDTSMSLFDDIVFRTSGRLVLGRVQRLVSHSSSRLEYSRPVELPCPRNDLVVTVNLYDQLGSNHMYRYTSTKKELAASKVLATVTLEYQPTSEEYVLSDDSIAKITELSPDCETETNQVAPTPRQREPSITDCLRSEVRPLPGSRSQRVRTVISYPYQ